MKIKFSPIIYIFVFYILLGVYLIISYFDFHQYLKTIEVIDMTPVAYGMLVFSITLVLLAFFSIFRIPFFHYLFKMVHLWIAIVTGSIVWLYFRYGTSLLGDVSGTAVQQFIVKAFPVSDPGIFSSLITITQNFLDQFNSRFIYVLFGFAVVVGVIQIVLYMPASLRYVYHTHISPFKYTFKHILVSVILLAPLLFVSNFYIRTDSSMDAQLETLLETETEQVDDSANAFYPMLTVWMPDVADRTAAGKQWVAEYRKMHAYFKQRKSAVKISVYPYYNKLRIQGMSTADQADINQLYIKRLTQNDPALETDIRRYAARYNTALNVMRSVSELKIYQEPMVNSDASYTEYFGNHAPGILSLHRLNLLISLTEHNEVNRILTRNIFSDYFFNMLVIKNSSDPAIRKLYIEKQAITAEFLYALLHDPVYQNKDFYKLISYVPTLDKQALDYSNVARNRILFFKKQIDESYTNAEKDPSIPEYMFGYVFKRNQTLNCIYQHANRELNLDNKNPPAHIKAQQTDKTKARLANVIGDIVCSVSIPDSLSDYYIKAVEANGRILMLKALADSTEKAVTDINMVGFLTNNSDKYYNPFSNEALKWDRDAKQIYFEYNNGRENIRITL